MKSSLANSLIDQFDDVVRGFAAASRGQWNGPSRSVTELRVALDAIDGIDTDAMRDSSKRATKRAKGGIGYWVREIIHEVITSAAGSAITTFFEHQFSDSDDDRDSADDLGKQGEHACKAIDDIVGDSETGISEVLLAAIPFLQALISIMQVLPPEQLKTVLAVGAQTIEETIGTVAGTAQDRDAGVEECLKLWIDKCDSACKPPSVPPAPEVARECGTSAPPVVQTPPACDDSPSPIAEPASGAPTEPAAAASPVESQPCDKPAPSAGLDDIATAPASAEAAAEERQCPAEPAPVLDEKPEPVVGGECAVEQAAEPARACVGTNGGSGGGVLLFAVGVVVGMIVECLVDEIATGDECPEPEPVPEPKPAPEPCPEPPVEQAPAPEPSPPAPEPTVQPPLADGVISPPPELSQVDQPPVPEEKASHLGLSPTSSAEVYPAAAEPAPATETTDSNDNFARKVGEW